MAHRIAPLECQMKRVSDLEADLDDAGQHGHFCEVDRTENFNLLREQLLNITQQAGVHRAGITTTTSGQSKLT